MPWYENRRAESLWYDDAGEGRALVLIHGWCMSSAVWKYQLDDLATSFRLITPDLRGHGRSRDICGNLNFSRFAEDLVDMFEHMALSSVVLVGWSMGAQIALQACADLSGRLAGMVLVCATPRFTASADFKYGLASAEASGMRLKVQRNTQRALDGFYTRLFAEGELENHQHSSEIRQILSSISPPDTCCVLDALDALAQTDMRPLLPFIDIPTLILNGSHDRICLPQASVYLKEHISGAEQTIFHGCGHAPFLTFSHRFNAELIRFIRSVCEENA